MALGWYRLATTGCKCGKERKPHNRKEVTCQSTCVCCCANFIARMATPYERGCVSHCHEDWFHGELTRLEAVHALKQSGGDCFLVRESKRKRTLVLSLSHDDEICHFKIQYGPGWYKLEGCKDSFSELQELVSHYSDNPIIGDKSRGTLRVACTKVSPLPITNPG